MGSPPCLEDEEDAWGSILLHIFDEVDGVGMVQQDVNDIVPHGGNLFLLLLLSSYPLLFFSQFCIVKENGNGKGERAGVVM